jgi:hypothetical protein
LIICECERSMPDRRSSSSAVIASPRALATELTSLPPPLSLESPREVDGVSADGNGRTPSG